MKKIAVLLTAALLLLSSACGIQPATLKTASPTAPVSAAPTASPSPELTPSEEPTLSPSPIPTSTLEPSPTPSPSPTEDPLIAQTMGQFNKNTYTNDFFGFSFTKPKEFTVESREKAEMVRDSYAGMLPGGAPTVYISFVITRQESNSIDVAAMSLMCAKLFKPLSSLSPSEFMKKSFDHVQTANYGGADFAMAKMTNSFGGITITNNYCCTIQKGYALMFLLTSTSKKDAADLLDIMKTIHFK